MKISREPTWVGGRQKTYPKIKGDVTADVTIIGGGLTGLLTAYLLSQSGKKVAVLEASTLGSGATAYTTAFVTQVIDTSLSDLIKMFGAKKAQRIWQAGEQAIKTLETIVKKEKIDCEFQRCSAGVYAASEKEYKGKKNPWTQVFDPRRKFTLYRVAKKGMDYAAEFFGAAVQNTLLRRTSSAPSKNG